MPNATSNAASSKSNRIQTLIRQLSSPNYRNDELAKALLPLAKKLVNVEKIPNLYFVVPLLFHYGGGPIDLKDYPVMEPLYSVVRPPRILLLCSRQVGKTVNMATTTLLESIWTPHLNTLFVSPFYETVRRVSTDYFAGMIQSSPVRQLFQGKGCVNQVLERSFPNGSRIRFTYAHRSADRARGIHARSLKRDEVQLMHEEILPVLMATMSSSPWGNYVFDAGTPLTNANAASRDFKEKSTRSHWMIPCRSCGKENIAALEYDLVGMIGPRRKDISRDRPAIICANKKCGYWLYPWDGRYVHLRPERREEFLGIHVPQTVLPLHCCDSKKWSDLISVLEDPKVMDFQKYNEYLGVPWDDGVALITEADLDRACSLPENRFPVLLNQIDNYQGRVAIGIDWGGGGVSRESRTKLAIAGINPSNAQVEVRFGMDLKLMMGEWEEAQHVWHVVKNVLARCPNAVVCYDDNSVGAARMEMLCQMGLPRRAIWPMSYVGETKNLIMVARPPIKGTNKVVWSIDKARSLKFLIQAIKRGRVKFFKKTQSLNARDLLLDFTHLVAEERVAPMGNKSDMVLIQKQEGMSDDFAHACNFACLGLWKRYETWPKLGEPLQIRTSQDLASYVDSLHRTLDSETIEALIRSEEKESITSGGADNM
ncbi:MAG: hypothetical protein KatS3mg109_0127 [Pirellulaceae bacterium]|nr:MAG: hypothetical protein KatS3mg109_0127 [Pirellulaceae bacterium]